MNATDTIRQLFRGQTAGPDIPHLTAAWLDTPLGPMLAVADDQDLLVLEFAEQQRLTQAVRHLPGSDTAVHTGINDVIRSIETELGEYFAGRRTQFHTPLRTHGTEFQKSVWAELQRIPPGETISYRELAGRVGRPTAFRAAAQANGANRLAIIIPCHRVISADGSIGGYGGGLARKRHLLNLETGGLPRQW